MADTGIFATTAEVQRKIGADANTTANAEAYINQFISEAESFINCAVRYNFSDAYAGLNEDVKGILKEAASNLAAIYVLNYDPDSFPSLANYQTRLDVLTDRFNKCIAILKEQYTDDFINDA